MACDNTPCKGTVGPTFTTPDNGVNNQPCVIHPNGKMCPPVQVDQSCKPFQLAKNGDDCVINSFSNEALNIGGAIVNVYKLLGVHEQGQLVDVTGKGQPISGGDAPFFPAGNAFDVYQTEWHSLQTGQGVIASSFIGYDFGNIKLEDQSRRKYGIETSIRKNISAIIIKQSSDTLKRVTRARVERSEDGKNWYGVSIITLPDNDCLNTILFKGSVLSRYWRIRPLDFNGSATDFWGVQALMMFHDFEATNIDNIQDKVLLENRDRDYDKSPIELKGFYDLLDTQTELSKFGIELPTQSFYIVIHFVSCVKLLGRPIVIGDIIELPSETQFSPDLSPIKKYLEVTDVGWSTESYTPGWTPSMLRIIAQPMFASQETQDIVGDLHADVDAMGLFDIDDGNHPIFQDYSDASQQVQAEGKELVPEQGAEGSSAIREFESDELQIASDAGVKNLSRVGLNPTGLYVEDAMPPNNAPFSEGETYPTNPSNGDYHRLVYKGLSKDVPARLYRYSSAKKRWIFLEKDRRAEYDPTKPRLQEFLSSPTATPPGKITNDKNGN